MTVEKAPLIVPEQRILIYLFMFGGGIAAFHGLDADWKWGEALYAMVTGAMVVCALLLCAVRGAKGHPFFALMGVQFSAQFCGHDDSGLVV